MAVADREKWSEFYDLLLGSIDIQAKCEEWGLEFTGHQTDAGWAECHAKDRPDSKASAAVNLVTGYYRDLGPGPSYPFFRLGVEYGPYANFMECINELAKEAKVLSKMPKSKRGQSFWSRVKEAKWSDVAVLGLCKSLNIKPDILRMIGAGLCVTNSDEVAACFPVMDAMDPEQKQKGWVLKSATGGKLRVYKGRGAQDDLVTNKSIGEAGLLNRHAISNWRTAEVIYKVEGISDMITLQSKIPKELQDKHVVVTNSDGCDSKFIPGQFADLCRGKKVIVIHDADEPGQFGATGLRKDGGAVRWMNHLRTTADAVLNLQLYDEIAEKKGKDLRDWFNEGHTYEELQELTKIGDWWYKGQSVVPEFDESNLDEYQMILRTLDLIVIGHNDLGHTIVFNGRKCEKIVIPDIDRFSYNKQMIFIGEAAKELIANPKDPGDDRIDHSDVQTAISQEAGGKLLSRSNTLGVGIWESSGRSIAVGTGEWIAVNGEVSTYVEPMIDSNIVDFGTAEEEWYNRELLLEYLTVAKSPAWRREHFDEICEVFSRWGNHTHPQAELILASLMIASWGQSIWSWRPWVAIVGESSTGKTALMDFIANYFGHLALTTSNASEAGIRNTIQNSSRILMHDEFETSKNRSSILEMLMASNRRGKFGQSLRSNSAQGSVTNEYNLLPWFSAVEMKMDKQTEANRYIMFEMGSRDGLPYFEIPSDEDYFEVLRNKSIACVMRIWKTVMAHSDHIVKSLGDNYSRKSESYSLVSATYGAMRGMSAEEATEWHKALISQLEVSETIEKEETEQEILLGAIMSSQIISSGTTHTVGSLLESERDGRVSVEDLLSNHGIKRVSYTEVIEIAAWKRALDAKKAGEEPYVFFGTSKNGAIRRRLLKDTDFRYQNVSTILSRISGAIKTQMRVNGAVTRGVLIPASVIGSAESKEFPSGSIDINEEGDDFFETI